MLISASHVPPQPLGKMSNTYTQEVLSNMTAAEVNRDISEATPCEQNFIVELYHMVSRATGNAVDVDKIQNFFLLVVLVSDNCALSREQFLLCRPTFIQACIDTDFATDDNTVDTIIVRMREHLGLSYVQEL